MIQSRIKGGTFAASCCPWNKNAIVLYKKLNNRHRYEDCPEDTLGQKIRKQRFLKGLTANDLAKKCGLKEYTIYSYETENTYPHYTSMNKICNILDVPVEFFEDAYYIFVLSDNYESYLQKWRKENTTRHDDVKKILGVSYGMYRNWEKGYRMRRQAFEMIRDHLGL